MLCEGQSRERQPTNFSWHSSARVVEGWIEVSTSGEKDRTLPPTMNADTLNDRRRGEDCGGRGEGS